MEYPRNDEEFYNFILDKTKEIKEMSIPEEKKKELYILVDETVQRHYENKKVFESLKENIELYEKAWERLYGSLENMGMLAQEIRKNLPNLEKIVKNLQQIKKEKDLDNHNRFN